MHWPPEPSKELPETGEVLPSPAGDPLQVFQFATVSSIVEVAAIRVPLIGD